MHVPQYVPVTQGLAMERELMSAQTHQGGPRSCSEVVYAICVLRL